MHKPRILLINPPIYDFSAFDFWLKPYGLLRVAGQLRGGADLQLFDFLDRLSPQMPPCRRGVWGQGRYHEQKIDKPDAIRNIPRNYRRFGIPRGCFRDFLTDQGPFDFALIQTTMTYWYPGVAEVLADLREFAPSTKSVLGGVYATILPDHARSLGPSFVHTGLRLDALWSWMGLTADPHQLPYWEGYPRQEVGILKLADGCPFRCTYCSVPQVYPPFRQRSLDSSLAELDRLVARGVHDVAFYDDALLHRQEDILLPFLDESLRRQYPVRFHTPNALNARFLDRRCADRMVEGGFKTFFIGFESSAYEWQTKTGKKVYAEEFESAVGNLLQAGADPDLITAYLIVAHPAMGAQNIEQSMLCVNQLGVQIMLSEFSPIPGTPDGEACRRWVDLDEPLWHSKTAFPIQSIGVEAVNQLKALAKSLNKNRRGSGGSKAEPPSVSAV